MFQALGTFKDWPALWTGRALTHLQLGHLDKALHDCDWAFRVGGKAGGKLCIRLRCVVWCVAWMVLRTCGIEELVV